MVCEPMIRSEGVAVIDRTGKGRSWPLAGAPGTSERLPRASTIAAALVETGSTWRGADAISSGFSFAPCTVTG